MTLTVVDSTIGGVDPDNDNAPMSWTDLRFAFVNCSMLPSAFAEKFGMNAAELSSYIRKGKWLDARRVVQEEISREAQILVVKKRAEELAEFNKADLMMAKSLRSMVAFKLSLLKRKKDEAELLKETEVDISPTDLRTMASTVESTQRIGRLALGASTENTELTGKAGASLGGAPTIYIGGPAEEGEPLDLEELIEATKEDISGT